jgi:quinol monooxygenase YgiN
MKQMESLQISIYTKKHKTYELLRVCFSISKDTRQIRGCHQSEVRHIKENTGLIELVQQWEHRTYLDNYFRSDLFSALLGAMKWLGGEHKITISDGSSKDGMVTVVKARSAIDNPQHHKFIQPK